MVGAVINNIRAEATTGQFTGPVRLKFKNYALINTADTNGSYWCSYWDTTKEVWSNEGCNYTAVSSTEFECVCDHLTNFAALMDISGNIPKFIEPLLTWITIVGCSLSITFLVLGAITFATIQTAGGSGPVHQRETGKIHRNLCVTLALAQLFLIAGLDETGNAAGCSILAAIIHYLFLAAFVWMNIEAIHFYQSITQV
jgi:hypothetical protein